MGEYLFCLGIPREEECTADFFRFFWEREDSSHLRNPQNRNSRSKEELAVSRISATSQRMKYCPRGCRFPDENLQFCLEHGVPLSHSEHRPTDDSTLILHTGHFAVTEPTPFVIQGSEVEPAISDVANSIVPMPNVEDMIGWVYKYARALQTSDEKGPKINLDVERSTPSARIYVFALDTRLLHVKPFTWAHVGEEIAFARVGLEVSLFEGATQIRQLMYQPVVRTSNGIPEFGWRRESTAFQTSAEVAVIAMELLIQPFRI